LAQPADGRILLPGLDGKITKVAVLTEGTPCTWHKDNKGIIVIIPSTVNPEKELKVIEIAFEGGFSVPPINSIPYTKNLVLDQHNAFKYYSNSGIDYNSRYQSTIQEEWTLLTNVTGKRTPVLHYTDQEKGRVIELNLNGQKTNVALDGGEEVVLKNNTAGLTWGAIYRIGPLSSGIDGIAGQAVDIDLEKPWGRNNRTWEQTGWVNDQTYTLPADRSQAWYLLQEITAPVDRQVLVSITSGDAVTVLLNGKTLVLHNNPFKKERMQDVVLLDLKKGKNQLLVKVFNCFQKEVHTGISTQIPQRFYIKRLEPVNFRKKAYFPVQWKLANPITPHETLNLPNLRLIIQ
jgi:alpha-L-fucosidase